MEDNRAERLADQFADAALQLLLDEYAAQSGARLLAEYESDPHAGVCPPELDEKCGKRIRRAFRKKRLLAITARCAKAAIAVLVCLCFSLTLAMSVEAIRVPMLRYYLERFPGHMTITTRQEETAGASDIFAALERERESFAPEGYSLTQSEEAGGFFTAIYENDRGDMAAIHVGESSATLSVDTEDCTETKRTVNGLEAFYWRKKNTPVQSVLLLVPEKEISCHLYASNLSEADFWAFVYGFAAWL